MIGQPKSFASLSSGLLARKGQAKPAMRPQGFSGFGAVSEAIDDLGWNDMGHNDSQPGPAPIASVPLPPVLRERQVLTDEMSGEGLKIAFTQPQPNPVAFAQVAPVPVAPAPVMQPAAPSMPPAADEYVAPVARQQHYFAASSAQSAKVKVAFTLRLDGDRHFRLRLATALCHQSAQQLVTEALDRFLETLPEVEAMASRLSAGAGNDVDDEGLN